MTARLGEGPYWDAASGVLLWVLYRLDAGGVLTAVITGVTISNGSEPLSAAERAAHPLAGRLLRLRPGVTGFPPGPAARLG